MKENSIVIGIDHGFGYLKTAHSILKSGIREQAVKPYFTHNILKYQERYYVAGQTRSSHTADKTETMEYYYLTLCGIAEELSRIGKKQASVILAAGLPYSFFSRQKQAFQEYLSKESQIHFMYQNVDYNVYIKEVYLFPQGFPVIAKQLEGERKKLSVVDIGSRTIDVLTFRNGKAQYEECFSIDCKGVLDCVERIRKAHTDCYQEAPEDEEVQEFLMDGANEGMEEERAELTERLVRAYIQEIKEELQGRGIPLPSQVGTVIVCGGGAALMERYAGMPASPCLIYEKDIHANAKGYEALCRGMLKKKEGV